MEHLILQMLATPRGRLVVAGLTALLGILFCLLAWPRLEDARRLRSSGVGAEAEVVESRSGRDQHLIKSYSVRYRFRVPGRPEWFVREERGMERRSIWSTLPYEQWERARTTSRLAVVYAPDAPHVNCPASEQAGGVANAACLLGFAGLLLGGGSFWLGWLTVGRRSRRPPNRRPAGVRGYPGNPVRARSVGRV